MISPQLAAGLTGVVGLSMVAGWVSAFRNRAYLGWLGLGFLVLSGAILVHDRVSVARQMGLPYRTSLWVTFGLVAICIISFLLALVAAYRETKRRIMELQAAHQAREEALLEMIQAARAREETENAGGGDGDPRPGSNDA